MNRLFLLKMNISLHLTMKNNPRLTMRLFIALFIGLLINNQLFASEIVDTDTRTSHYVSFPVVVGATVLLRDPDTMNVIHQLNQQTSGSNGSWLLERSVFDNFNGDLVLIDVAGGTYTQDNLSETPVEDAHLYALVHKESLHEGSVTVSFFTHLSYLSMQENKRKLTREEYVKFLEENNKALTSESFVDSYTQSTPEKALYLRPHNVVTKRNEYLSNASYFFDKIYAYGTFSAFSALTTLSIEKQVSDIFTPEFRFKMFGWGYEIEQAKSTSFSLVVFSRAEVPIKINGEARRPDYAEVHDGLLIQSYWPQILDDEPIVVETLTPAGTPVRWFDCDLPIDNICHTGDSTVNNLAVKVGLP